MEFVDEWPDRMVYEATNPDEREEIRCSLCGAYEYKDCARFYDGKYYCSNDCKSKAILQDAGANDFKEFVLSDVRAFMDWLKSDDYKQITDMFDSASRASKEWAEIFAEYADDCRYEFAEWYEWITEERRSA